MGRFKVKLMYEVSAERWSASLYEDRPNASLKFTGEVAMGTTREEALDEARRIRERLVAAPEPEWIDLADETPEPQSLKAV